MSETKSEQDKTPGIFSWNELVAHDTAAGTKFYTELFGWTAEEMDMGEMKYTSFKAGERPVAGMMALPDEMKEQVPSHWLSYITVEDINASLEKAKGLGAKVCREVTELPFGKFAIITDPQGAGVALWEFGEDCAGS